VGLHGCFVGLPVFLVCLVTSSQYVLCLHVPRWDQVALPHCPVTAFIRMSRCRNSENTWSICCWQEPSVLSNKASVQSLCLGTWRTRHLQHACMLLHPCPELSDGCAWSAGAWAHGAPARLSKRAWPSYHRLKSPGSARCAPHRVALSP